MILQFYDSMRCYNVEKTSRKNTVNVQRTCSSMAPQATQDAALWLAAPGELGELVPRETAQRVERRSKPHGQARITPKGSELGGTTEPVMSVVVIPNQQLFFFVVVVFENMALGELCLLCVCCNSKAHLHPKGYLPPPPSPSTPS